MTTLGSAAPDVLISIDQGTTNTKAVAVSDTGQVLAVGSAPVGVSSPRPGWVEQSADRIWSSVLQAVADCLAVQPLTVRGICLSTQRESVLGWSATSGRPLGPVIGWQDRRTADWCAAVLDASADVAVRQRTGLQIDAMFSAPKMRWLLDHDTQGTSPDDIRVGTIDSWLLWNLTGGSRHLCEAGNASRTLLFDVVGLDWSADLLDIFGVPRHVLPDVLASDGEFGTVAGLPGLADGTPILAVMADSHAALYGQGCTEPGMAKATYGTGSSVMTPVEKFIPGGLPVPPTLAWVTDHPTYAREGNILSSGATLAWAATILTGGDVGALVQLAATVPTSENVTLIPAFAGLGAPHWDRNAQALVSGIGTSTTTAHIARAAVDAVAHQICDVVDVIERDGAPLSVLRADGGVTRSDLIMQTQADLLGRDIEVADVAEVSALGAARLGWRRLSGGRARTTGAAASRRFQPARGSDRLQRRDRWRAELERARYVPRGPEPATR